MADRISPSDVFLEVIDAARTGVEFNFVGGFGLAVAGDGSRLDLEHLVAAGPDPRHGIAADHRRPQQRTGKAIRAVKIDFRLIGWSGLLLEGIALDGASGGDHDR